MKTSFILQDDEVNVLKIIQKLRLIVYQVCWWNAWKQSIFHTRGSNFASNFPSRQACQNVISHAFEKQIYNFLRIDQIYVFVLKINVLL